MSVKYDVTAITNGYISQLHYVVSRIIESNNNELIKKEFEEILRLNNQFNEKVESEIKKLK